MVPILWSDSHPAWILCLVVSLFSRRPRKGRRPHHHLPRVLILQRSARRRLPQRGHLPDQHPQVEYAAQTTDLCLWIHPTDRQSLVVSLTVLSSFQPGRRQHRLCHHHRPAEGQMERGEGLPVQDRGKFHPTKIKSSRAECKLGPPELQNWIVMKADQVEAWGENISSLCVRKIYL